MKFPMWLIRGPTLMELQPPLMSHEDLMREGKLIKWEPQHSRTVAFISHEWAGTKHPDPEFKQFRVLQNALQGLSEGKMSIRREMVSDVLAIPLHMPSQAQQENCLDWDFWYDYFSCPQLSAQGGNMDTSTEEMDASRGNLEDAISSIPAYCHRSDFVLVLAPTLVHADLSRVMSSRSWGTRAWCRVERTAAVCSRSEKSLLILTSPQQMIVSAGPDWVTSWPGQGMLSVEADRNVLQALTGKLLQMKSEFLLMSGDKTNWRFFQALQPKAQGHVISPDDETVEGFLQRYRMPAVSTATHGMTPLMLACLEGNLSVIWKLLEQKAQVDELISWRLPEAHLQGKVITALSIAAALSTDAVVSTLLDFRASLDLPSGLSGSGVVLTAAYFGNSSVLATLIDRRGDMNARTILGENALMAAVFTSNIESTRILLERGADPNSTNYLGASALSFNCLFNTTPRHAELLLQARADPNQRGVAKSLFWSGVAWALVQKVTSGSPYSAHWNLALCNGGTPLHFAALNGNLELVELLLDSEANLEATWGDERLTPFQLAKEHGHGDIIARLDVVPV